MRKVKKGKIKFLQKVKLKKIILNCIYVIIAICVLYNIIFSINTSISKKEYFKLYGISLFCMKTDLMEEDINENDLIIVKEVEDKELQNGDIIAYEVNGKIRINKIIDDQEGYMTKSNKNYYPDIEKTTINKIVGKKIINIPFIGLVLELLQSKIASVFTLLFLIVIFSYNRYMYTIKKERGRKKREIGRTGKNI